MDILRLVKVLIAVDIGIVVFCYLEDELIWLYNTQTAFFATALIVIGSFVGYSNLVKANLLSGNVGEDVLKKYEDPYNMDEEEEVDKEKLKELNKNLKWHQSLLLSFKGGFNFIRIGGYIALIAGFLWLKSNELFDFMSFLFGVSVVPAVSLTYLFIESRRLRRENENIR
ncbi:MAG: hypothetical protein GXO62_07285 [Epsilonproteobacteria bacterium]|nr:hypothetical protein [Campylobacterota bacterium]